MDAQNHDNQVNITHLAEIEREQSIAPLSYTRTAPLGLEVLKDQEITGSLYVVT